MLASQINSLAHYTKGTPKQRASAVILRQFSESFHF